MRDYEQELTMYDAYGFTVAGWLPLCLWGWNYLRPPSARPECTYLSLLSELNLLPMDSFLVAHQLLTQRCWLQTVPVLHRQDTLQGIASVFL